MGELLEVVALEWGSVVRFDHLWNSEDAEDLGDAIDDGLAGER